MSSQNSLVVVAIIATLISAVTFGFTYITINNLKSNTLTGFVVDNKNATVNITISSSVVINFSTDNINFGTGSLYPNTVYAVLDSAQNSTINGTWADHNFSGGLILDNIGTANATLQIRTLKNASQFLGDVPGSNPMYVLNISNVFAGSCKNTSGWALGRYYNVTTDPNGNQTCDTFGFATGANRVRIDVRLGIPINSFNGTLGDIISATATG